MIEILLASGSPRRLQLLHLAGFEVLVRVPAIDESRQLSESVEDYLRRVAQQKARAVGQSSHIIVAADTVVCHRGQLIGKPKNRKDAGDILRGLSASTHEVWTGFYVNNGERSEVGVVKTEVCFSDLSETMIQRYLDTGEANDKAGAYGIQGAGGCFVESLEGSYTNVVGLPMREVRAAISSVGR